MTTDDGGEAAAGAAAAARAVRMTHLDDELPGELSDALSNELFDELPDKILDERLNKRARDDMSLVMSPVTACGAPRSVDVDKSLRIQNISTIHG